MKIVKSGGCVENHCTVYLCVVIMELWQTTCRWGGVVFKPLVEDCRVQSLMHLRVEQGTHTILISKMFPPVDPKVLSDQTQQILGSPPSCTWLDKSSKIRCLNNFLVWFSTQKSSNKKASPSSLQMAQPLALSLRLNPATLQWKQFFASSICSLGSLSTGHEYTRGL